MILIGNKSYNQLKLNNVIDCFDKNIRFNFGLPNFNNGTIKDIHYANVHVYDNIFNNANLFEKYKKYTQNIEYLDNFKKNFNPKHYSKVVKQDNNKKYMYNNYLKKIKCPYLFTKIPRLGCDALMDTLMDTLIDNNTKCNIYLTNFSLNYDDNYKHLYNNKKINSYCHDINNEIDIIIWLHNNKYIDASMCCLYDNTLPIFDCKNIKPSLEILNLFHKEYGVCKLQTYLCNDMQKIRIEYEYIFTKYNQNIQILDDFIIII